jgi:hypothetical protein
LYSEENLQPKSVLIRKKEKFKSSELSFQLKKLLKRTIKPVQRKQNEGNNKDTSRN